MLAALQLYSSDSFQWIIGRSCGISQPSISLAVDAVTRALVRQAPEFISFPTDRARVIKNKLAFHAIAGFPNVLGAVDGTHVAIKAPSQNEDAFVNRRYSSHVLWGQWKYKCKQKQTIFSTWS